MTKEIIGFINKNNDIFNIKEDSSASKYCCKVGQGHENKIAAFTEDGDLKDSGYEPADFAETDHEHNYIEDFSGYNHCGARIMVGEDDQGAGVISMLVKGDGHGTASKTVKIGYYEADNLQRALQDPDSIPTENSNKLITSGGVNAALDGKQDALTFDSTPTAGSTNPVTSGGVKSALDNKRQIRQDDPETSDHAIVTATASEGDVYILLSVREEDDIKSVHITHDNIPNLQRALEDPAAPASGGDKLITNGQVFDAIAQKNSIEQEDLNDEQKALLSARAEDDDIYFDFRLKNGNTEKQALLTLPKMDNFNRALEDPDTIPTSGSSKLVTSNGVYNGLQDRPSRKEIGATVQSMLRLVKTSYPERCQGGERLQTYDFQEYIETYTDANGKLWTIYLWSDGGADYFMLESPAEMQINTPIYEYNVSSIAAIKSNTAATITSALTSFEQDTVGNI